MKNTLAGRRRERRNLPCVPELLLFLKQGGHLLARYSSLMLSALYPPSLGIKKHFHTYHPIKALSDSIPSFLYMCRDHGRRRPKDGEEIRQGFACLSVLCTVLSKGSGGWLYGLVATLLLLSPRTCFQVGWVESEFEFRNLTVLASPRSHKAYCDLCKAAADLTGLPDVGLRGLH